MKKSFIFLSAVILLLHLPICSFGAEKFNLIPYPQQLIPSEGKFSFNKSTLFVIDMNNKAQIENAKYFAEQLKTATGIVLKITDKTDSKTGFIRLKTNLSIAPEGYKLIIDNKKIEIEAAGSAGFFYAIQTLFQLMPPQIYSKDTNTQLKISVPCVTISDAPRFPYRGAHLDVCRHFFSVAFVKKYIDALAMHKINTFHWHLTEDQGWRIEIKKYPKLTEIGSVRERTLIGHYSEFSPQRFDNKPYGGFYTQDDAREVVAYAATRNITVIPEIEMPGHAMAALAAYPELSCKQQPIKVADKWGIFKDVYCTRDTVFNFLENVLDEIMNIFPSRVIHIGGDECPKDSWKACAHCQARIKELGLKDEHELQSYFIQRIEKYINSKGRKIIGWDEILEGGLAPNATVMSWRGIKGGIQAAKEKHDVIMTPGTHCYFDHYQSLPEYEPTAIGGYTPLSKVYDFEPVPQELTPEEQKYIIGAQANVWTEYIAEEKNVEYMAFPRMSAFAEVLWTKPENKDKQRFMNSMPTAFKRYEAMNITPSQAYYSIIYNIKATNRNTVELTLTTDNTRDEIYYSIDGSMPTRKSLKYTQPIVLTSNKFVRAQAFEENKKTGELFEKQIFVSKVTGMNYKKSGKTSGWYTGGNEYALTDGNTGITNTYSQWLSFSDENSPEVVFDLKELKEISKLSVGMLHAPFLNGFYCTKIKILTSENDTSYKTVAEKEIQPSFSESKEIIRPELEFQPTKTRYVKLIFENNAEQNAKIHNITASNLFIDEINIW